MSDEFLRIVAVAAVGFLFGYLAGMRCCDEPPDHSTPTQENPR